MIAIGRSSDTLDQVVDEIRTRGGLARSFTCDVTDRSRVNEIIGSLQRLDVVVNCAGTNIPEPFLEVPEAHYESLFAVNVKGTFLVSQAAVRRMVSLARAGVIINVSSQMGHVGAPLRTVYCMTKHAVEGLTKALALEVARLGIRVNSVAPTFVETSLTAPFFADPDFRLKVEERIPLGRIGHVDDVAGAVVFLASPAAALVTGASLLVDGGWTAQ